MDVQDLVIKIAGNDNQTETLLGGKASSLNRMIQAGFPVPPAYCITVPAYKQFVEAANPGNNKEVQKTLLQADIPLPIKEAILEAYQSFGDESAVAVRSSAIGEDSENQSFAGQYDTFLHVEGADAVLSKVKACWGSLHADRVQGYGTEDTTDKNDAAIAVVIQKMIDADSAGVLFTQDPVNPDADHMIIDSCWGLGEGVVSGQVVTDTFHVNKRNLTIADSQINEKKQFCTKNPKGIIALEPTPEKKMLIPSLTPDQIGMLAEQANKLRDYYGKELDIEWAFKDGELWLLQARPITTQAKAVQDVIYANPWDNNPANREGAFFSRMDTGEIVTGLMTPLGLSFCRFYQNEIHGPAIKTMGLLSTGHPDNYMGYIQGHVYLNISGSAHMLRQCPPTRDEMKFTTRYATSDIDFSHYKNPYGEGVKGYEYVKSSLFWLKGQIKNMASAKKIVDEMIALRESETQRFLQLSLDKLTLEELDKELSRIDHYFRESCAAYMPFFLQSFALYDALTEACEEHLGGEGDGLQNRIKASMNNLRTIEVTKGIVDLVSLIKANPILKALFEKHTAEELLELLPEHSAAQTFWHKDFQAFLFNFGSRGRQEFELSIPRWSDDPTYLLNVMKTYLVNNVNLDAVLQESTGKREADSEKLLKKLPFGPRTKIRMLIKLYGTMAERREATRPTFISETWFYRKIIVEVLTRLEAEGKAAVSDLPFIDFNLFRDYLAGKVSAEVAFARELLEKNRQQHRYNEHAEEPPMALIGGFRPTAKADRDEATDSNTLKGLAASPGQLVAKARVITNLTEQVSELEKGEILVAKYTDATWTPLFLLAAGVVTDIGSTLSHSSIVAREFGIPAIVNLKHATTTIKTGDLLVIDGSTGTVTIKKE